MRMMMGKLEKSGPPRQMNGTNKIAIDIITYS
jgi:hypothetical protein